MLSSSGSRSSTSVGMCCSTISARRAVICDGPAPALDGPATLLRPASPPGAVGCSGLGSLPVESGDRAAGWGGVEDGPGASDGGGGVASSTGDGVRRAGTADTAADSLLTSGTVPLNRCEKPVVACSPENRSCSELWLCDVAVSIQPGSTPSEPCRRRPRTEEAAGMLVFPSHS